MLVKFSGGNIRSFRDDFDVSLVATSVADPSVVREIQWRNGGTASSQLGVLPAAGFFGANASGKSNVLRALHDMRQIVLRSFRNWADDERTERTPFRLDRAAAEGPSRYEVEVVLDGVLHHYGFVLDSHRILEEWAIRFPNGRPQRIFDRTDDNFQYGSTSKVSLARAGEAVRSNALLLSTAIAFRGSELRPLYDWFNRNLRLAEARNRDGRQVFTAKQMQDPVRKRRILALLRAADLGIVGAEEVMMDGLPPEVQEKLENLIAIINEGSDDTQFKLGENEALVNLLHQCDDGNQVAFKPEEESLGTAVWLGLVGPIIDALDEGTVLLADELDASLHPMLVEQIVQLFQDPVSNPKRAQLLFNSHDAHLLGDSTTTRILGRDQIWFTEKRSNGATVVYPLTDLNPRKEEAIAKRYMAGLYGAVPIVAAGDFEEATKMNPVPV